MMKSAWRLKKGVRLVSVYSDRVVFKRWIGLACALASNDKLSQPLFFSLSFTDKRSWGFFYGSIIFGTIIPKDFWFVGDFQITNSYFLSSIFTFCCHYWFVAGRDPSHLNPNPTSLALSLSLFLSFTHTSEPPS
ncbi:hypothetical protein QBC44DRAFT_327376, partial [Cladorrhinum sp. PSN332]